MTASDDTGAGHELVLTRRLDAPRAAVWRAWTEPDLLCRWFTPAPWTTVAAEMDLRPGGTFRTVMRSPEGKDHDNSGVFLEVVPEERLVFSDAYTRAWVPSEKPFMTAIVELEAEGDATRYVARARHWTAEDRERHEAMGFHEGWGKAADQLEAVAREVAAGG